MERSNQELLANVAAGDEGAFVEFYDRHAGRVFASLLRLLGDRNQAEDALQDTFWHVWRGAGTYDPKRSPPEAWLHLLARSRAVECRRRQKPAVPLAAGKESTTLSDPCSALERSESAQHVRAALAKLPEAQRAALALAFYGGLTYEQVARQEGIPLGTVKTRIRLGMRRLRCLLGG